MTRPDGSTIFVEGITFPIQTHRGFMLGSVTRDITERKQVEESLKESESKLKNAIRIARLGYWEWDIPNDRVKWSGSIFDIYDVDRDQDITYEVVMSRVHPDDREYHDQNTENWIKNRGGEPYEYRVVRRDGSIRYVRAEGEVLCDEKDEPIKFVGTVQDITERKQIEEALQKSEEKFRSIYEQSPIAIQLYDQDGKLIDVNPETLKVFGIDDKKHILGFDMWSSAHLTPETTEDLLNGKSVFIPGHLDFELAKKINLFPTDKSGIIYTDLYVNPLLQAGEITGYLVQFVDVTERKQAELERDAARQLFQTIFALSPVPTTLTSIADRRIVDINHAAEKWLGYSREELKGVNSPEINYWADPEERQQVFEILLAEGRIADYEFSFKTKSGATGRALVFAEIFEQQGDRYVLATFVDVTERVRTAEELQRYREHLEELVAERTAELEQSNEDLRRFALLAAGRELRMKELREEIKALRERLNAAGKDTS